MQKEADTIKKALILLCLALTVAVTASANKEPVSQPVMAVAPQETELPDVFHSGETSEIQATSGVTREPQPVREDGPEPAELETVYAREPDMTPTDVIEAYFEQLYLSYSEMEYIDISCLLDMSNSANRNMLRWSESLVQRRRLLQENDLCYVSTEMLPYTIEYDDVPEDNRMELWEQWLDETGNEVIHFRIKGEEGKAYPPVMAVNSQHSMFLKEIDGEIKITLHYFPGSVRKFTRAGTVRVPTESFMLRQLEREFGSYGDYYAPSPAPESLIYDPDEAVAYAEFYAETPNPDFYFIGDWVGNCANFVSQCVQAGFGGSDAMDGEWSGGDGGTPAWENVNYFWEYITSGRRMHGRVLDSAVQLQKGDIIQLRTATSDEEDRFTHMMIVVDEDELLLAQNSPGCMVYYSDLVNVETRYIRPEYVS